MKDIYLHELYNQQKSVKQNDSAPKLRTVYYYRNVNIMTIKFLITQSSFRLLHFLFGDIAEDEHSSFVCLYNCEEE